MKDKVVLVTGASKGIGASCARALARQGATVVLTARDQDALTGVAEDIRADGGTALAIPTDVTDPGAVERAVATTVEHFGRLDHAFNNANAPVMPKPLAEYTLEEFDRSLRTNVHGTFLGMKYQIPAMLASGGGSIVNMASVAGVQGTANLAGYVAGKAAIIGLTKTAALDYADQGVRVNVVAPGAILTHHLEAAGPRAREAAGAFAPMRRIGTGEEVADVVAWLFSDRSSYVTGATVPIDGGQLSGHKPPQMFRPGTGEVS